MNSLWLERFAAYRASPLAVGSVKVLLELKDVRRAYLLARYHRSVPYGRYTACASVQEALLREARNAKDFWSVYNVLLPAWCQPFSRKPRSPDLVNRLLDVGYHRLAGMVEKIISVHDIPPALGLIHRAHASNSKPLVYDLMEIFRADLVDFALLRYLRLKKEPVLDAQLHIGHFLHEIHALLERPYYMRDFRQCHRYGYYMDLQVVKFAKAVNRREVFEPLALPRRHDSRCACRMPAKETEVS